ncbi:MAG: SOS response-associated peptidase [Deltaproteobacteria bacterium]|nr:SOS response-associated peptidase [Deltaproteobacteria bacterium]
MCGRYTLSLSVEEIWDELDLDGEPGADIWSQGPQTTLAPRFNIAPSQAVPVVTDKSPGKLVMVRWGLVPFWAKDPKIGYRMLNARGETLADKPAFRDSFKKRRCLVVADGFYEWKRPEEPAEASQTSKSKKTRKAPKIPFYARPTAGGVLTFAGLWASWRPKDMASEQTGEQPGPQVISCTVVTTDAAGPMSDVHHRMPVILEGDARARWLDHGSTPEDLDALIAPRIPDLELFAVRPLVNSVKNDGPDLIVPADQDGRTGLTDDDGVPSQRILVD